MTNILDIARSGILTYRTALGVTGENIANVETEGYHRRDVTLVQNVGAQTTPTTRPTGGQGVRVEDVVRAFDGFLENRVRSGLSDLAASGTQLQTLEAAEDILSPPDGGISVALDAFFTSFGTLSGNPSNNALRRIALSAGEALAGEIAGAATRLGTLRDNLVAQGEIAARTATDKLAALAQVNNRMAGVTANSVGAANPIADVRDAILNELSQLMDVHAEINPQGQAIVRLGKTDGGPLLVQGSKSAVLSVTLEDRLTLDIDMPGAPASTRILDGGEVGGQSRSISAIGDLLAELDAFARDLTTSLNDLHATGLDLLGNAGGDLFTTLSWQADPAAMNGGNADVRVQTDAGLFPAGTEITLTWSDADARWTATDAGGATLATGSTSLDIGGTVLSLSGAARDGDRFALSFADRGANGLRFLETDPSRIAASAATLVAAAATNRGTANAAIAVLPSDSPALPLLSDRLADADTAADPVSLLAGGVVGLIPAGTTSARLASLGSQATADLALTDADVAGLTRLDLVLDGTAHGFDLTVLADGSPRPAGWTAADLAAAMASGAIVSDDGLTFAEVGLMAGAANDRLSISAQTGDFSAVTLTGGSGGQAATLQPAFPADGTLRIFTREGRQIAGGALTSAEAAALITEANGFRAGATYETAYLGAGSAAGYRGTAVQALLSPGSQALTLEAAPADVWSDGQPWPAATAARALSLQTPEGQSVALALPAGGTAATAAALLNRALPGLEAAATTTLGIDAPADGQVSFSLYGENTAPVLISGAVLGGRMDALALAINARTEATGIRAELSANGARLMLRQADGQPMTLQGYSHSAAAALTLDPLHADGSGAGSATITLAQGQSARVQGEVGLRSANGFTLTDGGVTTASALDTLQGGLTGVTTSEAGSRKTLTLTFDPQLDAAAVGADGAVSAPTRYSVTLAGQTVTTDAALAGATDAAGIARGLAGLLRADAPLISLRGTAPASLPPEGAAIALSVDGQTHTLRMTGGVPVISGPEEGRLTAAFGADGRLTVTAPGGSTEGTGISVVTQGAAAAAFGLGTAQVTNLLSGRPVTAADFPGGPATLSVEIGGVRHDLTLSAGSVSTPPGFPGTASVDGNGALQLEVPASLGDLRILPPGAPGVEVSGLQISATAAGLAVRDPAGDVVQMTGRADSLVSQRLSLNDLPPEDLIVVMSGAGNLRMAGSLGAVDPEALTRGTDVDLVVRDAAAGRVELVDRATGHSVATRNLGAGSEATMGGLSIVLSGAAVTGDRFSLSPNTDGRNDGRLASQIEQLRSRGASASGEGFPARFSGVQSDLATRTAAAGRLQTTNTANAESLERTKAELSAVDLDAEAARLVELQQAYQASAQVMSVAKDLFDQLMRLF